MSTRDQRRAKKRRATRNAEKAAKPRVDRVGPSIALELDAEGELQHTRKLGGLLEERFG